MTSHQTIYLEPVCPDCSASDWSRAWCEDPQEACVRCGKEWVAYDLRRALLPPAEEGE